MVEWCLYLCWVCCDCNYSKSSNHSRTCTNSLWSNGQSAQVRHAPFLHFCMYMESSVFETLDLPPRCQSAEQPTSMAMSRTAPLQDFFSFSLVQSQGQINACWLQNLKWQDMCWCMTIKISNMLNLLDTHPTFSSQSQAIWNWWQSFQGFPSDWILTNVKITRLNLPAVNSFYTHMRNNWSKYSPNWATVSSILTTFLQKQRNCHSGLGPPDHGGLSLTRFHHQLQRRKPKISIWNTLSLWISPNPHYLETSLWLESFISYAKCISQRDLMFIWKKHSIWSSRQVIGYHIQHLPHDLSDE